MSRPENLWEAREPLHFLFHAADGVGLARFESEVGLVAAARKVPRFLHYWHCSLAVALRSCQTLL